MLTICVALLLLSCVVPLRCFFMLLLCHITGALFVMLLMLMLLLVHHIMLLLVHHITYVVHGLSCC
jgi:hypothetical protein